MLETCLCSGSATSLPSSSIGSKFVCAPLAVRISPAPDDIIVLQVRQASTRSVTPDFWREEKSEVPQRMAVPTAFPLPRDLATAQALAVAAIHAATSAGQINRGPATPFALSALMCTVRMQCNTCPQCRPFLLGACAAIIAASSGACAGAMCGPSPTLQLRRAMPHALLQVPSLIQPHACVKSPAKQRPTAWPALCIPR